MKKNKKAHFEWLFVVVVILVVTAIMIPVGQKFIFSVNEVMSNSTIVSENGKQVINKVARNYSPLWDNLFFMLVILCWVGLMISFYFVAEHPVVSITGIIVIMIFLVFGLMMGNVFGDFSTNPFLSVEDFPKMSWIMKNWVSFIIAIGTSCLMLLYAKSRYGT